MERRMDPERLLAGCFPDKLYLSIGHQVVEGVGCKDLCIVFLRNPGKILLQFGQLCRIRRRWRGRPRGYTRADLQELSLEPGRRDDAEEPGWYLAEIHKAVQRPTWNIDCRSK